MNSIQSATISCSPISNKNKKMITKTAEIKFPAQIIEFDQGITIFNRLTQPSKSD
jgi:hypothetical protein